MQIQRKILVAFSSGPNRLLFKEIFKQLDGHMIVDFALDGATLLAYLVRNAERGLPGLVILDEPPVHPDIASLIKKVHIREPKRKIPVSVILPPKDIPAVNRWTAIDEVHFYARAERPSQYKACLRHMLGHYAEPQTFDQGACERSS